MNTIKEQKKIETEIETLKKKINKIQRDLLNELNKVYERTKAELDGSLKELEKEKHVVHDLKEKTVKIRHLSTNTETFLGTQQLRKRYSQD